MAKKVTKFRNNSVNIDMIVFGVIFIYVIICCALSLKSSHIVRYEVREGSLAEENTYRGVILREEEVVYSDTAGYVNYYAREGERVAKNALVYLLDETGRLNESLEALHEEENSLTSRELTTFKDEMTQFMHGFDVLHYEDTYDFKYTLKNTVLKLASTGMLDELSERGGNISYGYAPGTGIVSYWTDGLESLEAKDITAALFEDKEYEKKQMIGNALFALGDPVYKLSKSENWSLVIPIDPQKGAKLQEEEYVKVRFLKNQYESWGKTKLLQNADGNSYLELTFNNSMITFTNDRFLDVELILEEEKGLKIPVSSIARKEFFLVPETFVTPSTANNRAYIYRQCYLESGEISTEYLEIEVYNFDAEEKEYYLDSSILNAGDILYKLNGQETYTVSRRGSLVGVYNMNKGYADFKQINILYQNDEYAIVKSNTRYGLNVYDYIVLNAETVQDDQFIK